MNTPKNLNEIWDARIAIGIGRIKFVADNISTSDGEAFQYSRRAFEN